MKVCVLTIVLFFSVPVTYCQNTIGLPLIINYGKPDFHGGAQTWDIKQDRNGIMYFANNEGLLTFDGTYWKTYPLPHRTIIRSLAIDQNNRIYVGGQGEIGYFTADKNGFLHYESLIDRLKVPQQKFADIWDIKIWGESVFFRATDRIFELSYNNIQVFLPKSQWQFLELIGNKLIAQDKINGLFVFKNAQWFPEINNKIIENEIVTGITAMGKDSMLVTTNNSNFFIIKHDSIFKMDSYSNIKNGLHNTYINKTCKINQSAFVAGTTSDGLSVVNFNGRIIQKIARPEGLQDNNVLCVFLDQDKNIWTGLNNGISMIAYNAAIKYIRPDKTDELSGFSSKIYHNQLYIGSSNGAYVTPLSKEDNDLSFSKGEFSLIKNSNGQVWNLEEINQQLLMGHNFGTFIIKNKEAISLSTENSWVFLPISHFSPSTQIIAGTYTGLQMFAYSNNSFSSVGKLNGIYESFRFLVYDNMNTYWASHPYRGIYKIEISVDDKKYTEHLYTEKDGLPSLINNTVFKIKNRVLFATEKGVYEYDPAIDTFKPSAFLSAVFGTMELRYLKEDDEGNIWFCSGKKIGVVHFNGLSVNRDFIITYFPELTDQILSGFENIYPYNSENVFIGSERGIIHLNYKKYLGYKRNLTVLFSTVKSIGKSDSIVFGGYLKQIPGKEDEKYNNNIPHFPKNLNSFHFEFSSPEYGLQNNIEYSYKLSGFEKDWSNWTLKPEKDYTNLPDGKYSFQIKARDNLGNESKSLAYEFIITPPFYKTPWAYFLYISTFLLLVYLINIWQKRSLLLQKLSYEENQKQIIAYHNLEIEKNEKEIIKLQNEKLEQEVLLKQKELADASMHLVEREDAIARVKEGMQKIYKNNGGNQDIKVALQILNGIEKNKTNWDQFTVHFNAINNNLLKKLKLNYPELTNSDLKVCAYLQLNLSSKEIAQLLNISVRGVEISRYRIRKKLKLEKDQSFYDFFNKMM